MQVSYIRTSKHPCQKLNIWKMKSLAQTQTIQKIPGTFLDHSFPQEINQLVIFYTFLSFLESNTILHGFVPK